MKITEKYLSSKYLQFIPSLLGQKIFMIYSKTVSVDVNYHEFKASSFSLSLDKGFVCFQTRWIDMNDYDYYQLELSKSDDPIGVKRSKDNALIDPSSISMTPASIVKSIELYADKDEEEWNSEGRELITVKYDSAFLFRQEDGKSFLIGVSESIADLTQFIRDEKAIMKRLSGLEKRLEWKK
jgi:hypothetical protein